MTEKERLDQITGDIIGAAIEVHRALGPGLPESAVVNNFPDSPRSSQSTPRRGGGPLALAIPQARPRTRR